MKHIENIYDLLPEEIEELINKIIEALKVRDFSKIKVTLV